MAEWNQPRLPAWAYGIQPRAPYLKPFLALGAVASAVLAQRAIGSAALMLRWDVDRRTLSVRSGSEPWQPVEQLESTMVLPWCVLMRLRLAHGRIRLVVVPDSVSSAGYRRLSVLARLAPLALNVSDPATRN
ncbi:protein YgfX [Marinobacterium aestuariivivens]|uniref:Protein YgfX n=1 Tax=Marinobacterium aestuariivivens TaxID=1698799 RepID=A0ABW2A2R0_9GAMM